MELTVKGRTVTELFALAEISVMKECRADDILDELSGEEIVSITENGIVDYCKVAGI